MEDSFIIVLLVLVVGWLLLRGFRLWYWRINEQMDILNKINSNLEQLNKKVKALQISADAHSSSAPAQISDSCPATPSAPISNNDIPEM